MSTKVYFSGVPALFSRSDRLPLPQEETHRKIAAAKRALPAKCSIGGLWSASPWLERRLPRARRVLRGVRQDPAMAGTRGAVWTRPLAPVEAVSPTT
eukprot:scaffold7506_cov286-Pinguiococcus_pyrenoidosus.AAC.9